MKTIEYKTEFGEIIFPDGFEQKLSGRSLEEQMDFYRITMVTTIKKYSYGELDSKNERKKTVKLKECDDFRGLVVKDGIIVGVIFKSMIGEDKVCLPGQKMMTYWSSGGDGTGSTDRDDTCCLICV
ncbi:MAG TPA: hypothetical protein DCG30_02415 [Ruminococcus sp.]|nr:hypothetical protein [Ruminococcus sp.]